jgi:hypothetical protein
MLLAAAVFAIVTQDQAALRASPLATAPKNAVLWQGDALEVRGGRAGYLQVWDYRRERGGYVLEGLVRPYALDATSAAGLLEIVRLLRDMPGLEALGIGHAALYLKVAPAPEIGAEVFDAIGTMADRLSRRASVRSSVPDEGALAGHLDVAQGYGIRFTTLEQDGRTRVCYDGEAFRHALRLQPSPEAHARAVLGLTRPECESGSAIVRRDLREDAAERLEGVPMDALPLLLRHRVRLRRVALWSTLAFERARAGRSVDAQTAAARCLSELALVARADLAESDGDIYAAAAIRAAVARPAVDVAAASPARLVLRQTPKPSGETCLAVLDTKDGAAPLIERCTYGVVWPASVRVSPDGRALAVAVQPLDDWRELWLFHEVASGWIADVVAPAGEPGLGYIEWAGWTPDGRRVLVARETRIGGRFTRSFEIVRLDTMAVERKAGRPRDLTPFHRWQSPDWKSQTLALR